MKITNTYKFTPKKTLAHKICDLIPRAIASGFVMLGGVFSHLHWNEPTFSIVAFVVAAYIALSGLDTSK